MRLIAWIASIGVLLALDNAESHSLPQRNDHKSNSLKQESDISVHSPLLIGSFNIQTLGSKKFKNPDVIYAVEKIVQRYDLILIMEIMTADPSYMKAFLRDVNSFAPKGVQYNMTLSERHQDTQEHAAILYRTNKLKLLRSESYDDPLKFYRKPLIAIFQALTLRDMTQFGVVGHHAKPSQAVLEIDALAAVYDHVAADLGTGNVLLMGDFNADCTYVKESNWEDISLWTRSEFTWPIQSHTDTTTNYKSCALDRFVYAGEHMNNGVIVSSAQIFNYQKEFELTVDETRSISDHWPIEIKIRGKLSNTAEKHLSTKLCFKIGDSQPRRDTQRLNSTHFNVTKIANGYLLTNRTRGEGDLLNAVTTLRASLPDVVSHELEEAIRYKLDHGSLRDESSFAEVWEPSYTVSVLVRKGYSEATVCRATSIN